jgi:hypothetical protein
LEWNIGSQGPGGTDTLICAANTDTNPGGAQEYSSCGDFEFNSGAVLKFRNPDDKQRSFGTGGISLHVPCRLYIGSDVEEFQGTFPPDRLGIQEVNGAALVGGTAIVNTDDGAGGSFKLNGLAPTGTGNLYSGDPTSSAHNEVTNNGVRVSTLAGPLDADCCNEDLARDPATGNVWRADFGEGPLFEYNPVTGAVVNSYNQTDVVGATFVGNTLWITKWSQRLVGTFDPNTNTFMPKFSTATNAGGLAWDKANNILWVGEQGGLVQAWDLGTLTIIPGSQFQPFGAIPDTIDGLAFVGN